MGFTGCCRKFEHFHQWAAHLRSAILMAEWIRGKDLAEEVGLGLAEDCQEERGIDLEPAGRFWQCVAVLSSG